MLSGSGQEGIQPFPRPDNRCFFDFKDGNGPIEPRNRRIPAAIGAGREPLVFRINSGKEDRDGRDDNFVGTKMDRWLSPDPIYGTDRDGIDGPEILAGPSGGGRGMSGIFAGNPFKLVQGFHEEIIEGRIKMGSAPFGHNFQHLVLG